MVETSRRREIEDAASSLFHEHGYAGTSVREIARALDIQGASLYAHVTSKQDMLWSIVVRTADRFEAAADAALSVLGDSNPASDHDSDSDGTPAPDPGSRLTALVRAHVGVVTEDIGRASVFVHEWRSLSAPHRAEIGRRRAAYEHRLRAIIRDGMERGDFAATDPTAAAAFILTALNGLVSW
ncbi:MAG: TetR/AcrR family transcriptional regulator, partial [Chloroflexi bacterium]|nr:TetR/AcrR family transcriptional regulator [Chloroflexota bacterium]